MTRSRVLVASLVLLVVSAVGLVVTDVHGRAQIRSTVAAATSLRGLDARESSSLTSTRARAWVARTQDWSTKQSIVTVGSSLTTASAANSATLGALAAADYDIAALETCLAGATRALDQLAVGQSAGALASLSAVSSSCGHARSGNG
ncbi:MAG TPA: hypothetical protein VMU09_04485 [Acidimicrobiales bacterium]|nr:hypothetical protein [Acidimicrobiales bacterium]